MVSTQKMVEIWLKNSDPEGEEKMIGSTDKKALGSKLMNLFDYDKK